MENKDYLNNVENLTAEEITEGISNGKVTFDQLRNTLRFDASKQRSVKVLLKRKDDDAFNVAKTISDLEYYLSIFPDGSHVSEAEKKIRDKKDEESAEIKRQLERKKTLRKIKENINEFVPDEIINLLSEDDLDEVCNEIGINSSTVKNYTQPPLTFNEIPINKSDIPSEYTDVFFWGIPSSGKTCALAAIFSTIKKEYTMEAPDSEKKFGIFYRDSLINIFQNDIGNLPGRTAPDRTQYMPFLLSKRGEKKKRKISFFELSGEVFKYFYEVANNTQILDNNGRERNEKTFETLDLLLKSNNQKIHFFFIDYNQETNHTADKHGLSQSNYLDAATVYFRDNNDIFKNKTDAVFVVITKSDGIIGDDKIKQAKDFLDDHFGSFMDVLKNQCQKHSVTQKTKLFSIGDVYFQRICKINRSYSVEIIEDLIKTVKPINNSMFRNLFNS